MTIMEAISKGLKDIMREKGITILELAAKSNLSESTIKNIVFCKVKTIKSSTMVKIMNALKMNFTEFFKDTEFFIKNVE